MGRKPSDTETLIRKFGFIILVLSLTTVAGADLHVWTETQTVRFLREAPPRVSHEIRLSGGRNEWLGFQILLRSDNPMIILEILPSELIAEGGHTISSENFSLFRQYQIHLTEGTERNSSFEPGWYPDPLIPSHHPLTGAALEGKLKALPFQMPPNETHGFWIDISIPKHTPAALYRGSVSVRFEDGLVSKIPIELIVRDFSLPDTPTMQTSFGSPVQEMRGYYSRRARERREPEPTDWGQIAEQCSQLMSDHRINAAPSLDLLRPRTSRVSGYELGDDRIDRLRRFVDRYHVNAVQVPNPSDTFRDPQRDQEHLHKWLKAIDRAADRLNRPEVLFYTYLADEPNDWEEYRYIRKWGKAIRDTKSVVKVLVTEQTKPQNPLWGELYGAVDIWCSLFPLFDPVTSLERQRQGEILWAYTALCQEQRTPWWHIDYPLLNYRVPTWIAWRYGIQGLVYWGGMCHWTEVDDPWTDARTYRHKTSPGKMYNGEGTLVYPARPVGYNGIVPSLRLKALRRGIQDYEYLSLLDRLGLAEEGRKTVVQLASSWFQWNEDPAAYEKARLDLAELIVAAGKKK